MPRPEIKSFRIPRKNTEKEMDDYIKSLVEYKIEDEKVVWKAKKRLSRNMRLYFDGNTDALNKLIEKGTFKIRRRGNRVYLAHR